MTPKRHELRHRVYWLLLDLEELNELDSKLRLFSYNGMNLTSVRDSDHGDGTRASLLDQTRAHLSSAGINDPSIKVQLLCMPRVAGYDFNPLSVYFCSDTHGGLVAIIYEVNNTFGGRHSYVIPTSKLSNRPGDTVHQTCDKALYVSPFMELDMTYRFRTRAPADDVSVSVQARHKKSAIINTTLQGKRYELNDLNLLRLTATHPVLPMKVTGAIYWHALKMWLRGFAVNQAAPSTRNLGHDRKT